MIIDLSILVSIVIGLVQVAKGLGMKAKFAPLLSVLLAVGFNFVIKYAGGTAGELLFAGVMAGLMASGLYDVGDKSIEIFNDTLG